MSIADDELPVLKDVVRSGNKSAIRFARSGLSAEPKAPRNDREKPGFDLPSHLTSALGIPASEFSDSEIESRIDLIIDKHIAALRKELSILLKQPL